MVGLAFASVPLYRDVLQRPASAARRCGPRRRRARSPAQIGVRFDANVHPGLPWRFEPEQTTVRIAARARKTKIFYRAQTSSRGPTTGQAVFNVTPDQAGKYFNKIQCFCFTEQTLKPGESVDMPVVFFVDPQIRKDPDTRDIDEITLSYTFYPVETDARGQLEPRRKQRGKPNDMAGRRTTIIISSSPIPGR